MNREASKALKGYVSWLKLSRSHHTVRAYSREAKEFLQHVNKSPKDLTTLDVTEYLNHLEKKGFKRTSVYRVATGLKRLFRVIGRPDLADSMPMPKYESQFKPTWMPFDMLLKLFKAAKPGMKRTMLMIWYELALREGEIPLLNKSWLNRVTGDIKVRRLKRKGMAEDMISIREEAFYGRPLDALVEYLDSREDDLDAMFVVRAGRYGSGWRRIAQRTVAYYYRQAALKAGINPDKYRPHCLRHSRLTHMAIEMIQEYGVADIARIAKFAGHVNISTTLKYVHLAGEWLLLHGKKEAEKETPQEYMRREYAKYRLGLR
ncbi:MAG: tyrosine-type recombinase/integrase [Candidatus Nezhaarchaeales archaeon]